MQYLTVPKNANTLMTEGAQFADYANVHNYFVHSSRSGFQNNQIWKSADPPKNCHVDGLYNNFGLT